MTDLKIILDDENSPSQPPVGLDLWNMSFRELIAQEAAIIAAITSCDDPVRADEFIGLLQTVRELKTGKIDRIAELIKKVIPARIEALKDAYQAQLKSLNAIDAKLKNLVIESIQANQATKIEGTMWSARVQHSSSVEITDDFAIPGKYHEITTTIKMTYTMDDADTCRLIDIITDLITSVPNCQVKTDTQSHISKTRLRTDMKSNTIPGAEIVKSPYIRFDAASALPSTIIPELISDSHD